MKMLKKMAALLLVGVMALALLTACGDEAPAKSTAEQAEDAMTIAINQSMGTDFKNDESLKNAARKMIADNVGEDGKVEKFYDQIEGGVCFILVTRDANDEKAVAMGFTNEQVAAMKDPAFTQAFVEAFRQTFGVKDNVKNIKAFGVGAVTKGDKTYVAVAVTAIQDAQ